MDERERTEERRVQVHAQYSVKVSDTAVQLQSQWPEKKARQMIIVRGVSA